MAYRGGNAELPHVKGITLYLIYTMGQIDQLLIRDVYTSKGSIFDCLVFTTHMIFLQACQHSRHASYMVTYRI